MSVLPPLSGYDDNKQKQRQKGATMGCDIHSHVEVRRDGRWTRLSNVFPYGDWEGVENEPFPDRDYGLFSFLADVRNYSHAPVIAEPRGLPSDADMDPETREFYDANGHSASWLSLQELLDYDYDQVFWDRRVTKEIRPRVFDGAALAEEGEGRDRTLRDLLGERFFFRLETMQKLGDPNGVRVVFFFDN